ncbi:MAG TPA: NUDIX domain-containing protein [Spirochaetota bacterium]|nr:NUDIX domain-containing protein [Spirochaetota bacterium]
MDNDIIGVNVCAAFLPVNRRLMVVQRNEKGSDALKWELPGGKLEDGEDFETAIKRECKEELDLTVCVVEEVGSVEIDRGHDAIMFMFILVNGDFSKIKLKEHKDIKYVTYAELKKLDMCEADKIFVNTYEAEIRRHID